MKRLDPELGPWGFIQAFVFGGGIVALWLMPQWEWNGEVHVKGLRYLSPQLITRTADLPASRKLFEINPTEIRRRLVKLEAVEDAKVRRWLFPSRLDIDIRERIPRIRVLGATPPLYLDAQGAIFSLPGSSTPDTPISVSIASSALSDSDTRALRTLLQVWPKGSRGMVHLQDTASWSAVIDGVRLDLGDGERLGEKFRLYSHLLPLARQAGKAVQYLGLRFPEAPTLRAAEATP